MTTSTTASMRFAIFAPLLPCCLYTITPSCKTRSRGAFKYEIFDKSRTQKPKDYEFSMMAFANNTAVGAKMENLIVAVVLVVIAKVP